MTPIQDLNFSVHFDGVKTNTVQKNKRIRQQQKKSRKLKKKNRGKKSIAIAEEGFPHNQDQCVKSQKKSTCESPNFSREYPIPVCHDHAVCRKVRQEALEMELRLPFGLLSEDDDDEDESSNFAKFEMPPVPMMEDIPDNPDDWKKYDLPPEFYHSRNTLKETPGRFGLCGI